MAKGNAVSSYIKTLPNRLKEYFKKYFKSINYYTYIIAIVMVIGLFLSDYFTKRAAYNYFNGVATNPNPSIPLIPYILDLQLTFNKGAAWGSLSGMMWFLVIISSIATLMLTINVLFRFNRYNKIMMTGIVLMAPGAAGNLVDRIGYLAEAGIYKDGVIDFLHFTFWDGFPICNLADYYLSIGVVFLLIGFVIEFRAEYLKLKAEEEAEKAAEAAQMESTSGESDLMKKLQEKEKENTDEVDNTESVEHTESEDTIAEVNDDKKENEDENQS